jgi:hypothetical protein
LPPCELLFTVCNNTTTIIINAFRYHFAPHQDALDLVELDGFEKSLFEALGGAFWPGGLTLVTLLLLEISKEEEEEGLYNNNSLTNNVY